MKLKSLANYLAVFAIAMFSYGTANAQVVDAVKDAASKTKEVTVDAAKKTVDVTKDVADKTKDVTVDAAKKTADVTTDVADKTADVTVDGAKATASGAKKVGNYTVNVSENVAGGAYEGGKWFVTTTWDGTKWVSKKVVYGAKKAGSATKDFVVGDDNDQKP
jgi:hypothetical protein